MIRCHAEHHLSRGRRAVREERAAKAPPAALRQLDRLVQRGVRHHRVHRAEGFDVVWLAVRERVAAGQQYRREEGTPVPVGADHGKVVVPAEDHFARRAQFLRILADVVHLAGAGEWTHSHALDGGIADRHFRESLAQRPDHVLLHPARHDRATNRGAFLAGLRRHLADDLLHEEVELLSAGDRVGAKDRAVERVSLHVESHGMLDDGPTFLQETSGRCGAGESDGVLLRDVREQVACAAANELERAFGEDVRGDHLSKHCLSEIRRDRRRLDDRRNAGEQRRGELLQHPPARKIEGIDVERHSLERHTDVATDKRPAFRQRLDRAVDVKRFVGELAPSAAGVREKRTDASFDVDPRIGLRRTGRRGKRIESLLPLHQVPRHGLEHRGPPMKRQGAQLRPAHPSRVVGHRSEVQAAARRLSEHFAGYRVHEVSGSTFALDPLAERVAPQPLHEALPFQVRYAAAVGRRSGGTSRSGSHGFHDFRMAAGRA